MKLSNHLAQVHGMDIEERAKWLKWGKLEMCVPRHHGNGTDHELNMEKTLQELLKRIDDIETRFFMYLRTTKKHTGSLKKKRKTCKTSYKQEYHI